MTEVPSVVYLIKEITDLKKGTKTAYIDKEATSFDSVLNGSTELGAQNTDSYFVVKPLYAISKPWMLQCTSEVNDELVFISGADFKFESGVFVFGFDIRKLGLKELEIKISDTETATVYKLLYLSKPTLQAKEFNYITETPSLADCVSLIWHMQLFSASVLDIKRLLATVTESVFCTKDGIVTHSWIEQGYQHLLIADELYSAPLSTKCHVQHGDNVKAGQLLFGSLILNTYKDELPSYEEVPGITVQTDVGEVQLLNKEQDAVQYGDTYYLPVVADVDTKAAYYKRCQELKDNKIVDVPATVNPFALVRELRGANFAYASFDVSDIKRTSEAINHIRNTISAGSMFTVYVKAQSDPLVLNLYSFTASAGSCALSVCATLNVIEAASEAHVSL